MKHKFKSILFSSILAFGLTATGEELVILHTNDTHSNIEVGHDGTGGILPRKALIDSVRQADKNVILVDAGDMVQGTLYFNYFKGDVEYPLFNMMDYDIRILGNHEFDNGLQSLADHWKDVKGSRLSANYDFTGTPAEGIFQPYVIKKAGGKKIGFIGINIDPESLISLENYEGMGYKDAVEEANRWAAFLKKEKKCDLIVAVTHIGYTTDVKKPTDVDLAKASTDIDIIIGGHSHTFIDPQHPEKTPYWIPNANGVPVLVAQTGRYGKNVGYIKVDLDNIRGVPFEYRLIPVTDRFASRGYDKEMEAFLAPYKQKVDSVNHHIIGYASERMENGRRTGAYPNWAGDFALWYGKQVSDSLRKIDPSFPEVDMAMVNVGGIRQTMEAGAVTEGAILSTFPFSNFIRIVKIKGKDFLEAMKVSASKGGEAVSGNIRVVTLPDGEIRVVLDNTLLDPEKEYTLTTIDYLANGNDGLPSLANNTLLWSDPEIMNVRILDYIRRLSSFGLPMQGDSTPRFINAIAATDD